MDVALRKRFIAERAKALAMVMLTRRPDLVVKETKEETGLDLTVHVRAEELEGARPFGVYLAATMSPVKLATANQQLKPVLARVHRCGPFMFPVCIFYFTVKDDKGYYCWTYAPVVLEHNGPKLKVVGEVECQALDDEALAEIVTAVNKWYDAYYATMTA